MKLCFLICFLWFFPSWLIFGLVNYTEIQWRDLVKIFTELTCMRLSANAEILSNMEEDTDRTKHMLEDFMINWQGAYEKVFEAVDWELDSKIVERTRMSKCAVKIQKLFTGKLNSWYKLMKQILAVDKRALKNTVSSMPAHGRNSRFASSPQSDFVKRLAKM